MTIAVVLNSCSNSSVPDPGTAYVPEGYTLVWQDEFNFAGAPDPEKWGYSLGGNGWGNGEAQFYTDKRTNSWVDQGHLTIKARNENGLWTSARLKTQYKADWTYGYIEVRAKLPRGIGTWPAIWMLPSYDSYGGWPRSGEIDIMEHVGFDPDVVHTTVHTLSYNHKIGTQKNHHAKIEGATDGFHLYTILWDTESIQWFIDGKLFYQFKNEHATYAEWPFDKPFYLIMNLAIGGSWGGQKGIDKNLKEANLEVDYVRVYQKL
ncbi:glycoside hydrolase family 16 protein [Gracilinema caldarium]|uniref:Licheninase n=1 Tax=Gracilinema caldarium (strain ATCC 51460 / DSM 7334 / H1) TaxID=744872 RepID=F8F0B4_GRAC1|nr:glycoside hydrolase family 16 protein [Gracilinema caldarium]AEJ18978.1 Licheninase [Gracilinema caldarium DSM 7334]